MPAREARLAGRRRAGCRSRVRQDGADLGDGDGDGGRRRAYGRVEPCDAAAQQEAHR